MGCIASQASELDWAPPPPFPVPVDFHAALVFFFCFVFIKATTEKPALCGCDVIGMCGAPPAGGTEPPHWLLLGVCCRCACLSPMVPELSLQPGEKGGLPTGSPWVRVRGRIVPFPEMKVKSFPCTLLPEGKLEDMQEAPVDVRGGGVSSAFTVRLM